MSFQTGRFHDGSRWVAVLYRAGRSRLHYTYRDDTGIRHDTEALTAARYITPLVHRGAPYPVERMVRRFRAIGRQAGITDAAKAELKAACESA